MAQLTANRLIIFLLVLSTGLMLGAMATPPEPARELLRGDQQQRGIQLARPGEASGIQAASVSSREPEEPLFEGWPDPAMTLFVSGRQNGYLEPCGCTGLDNQKGGMMRRHTLFKRLQSRGWNPIGLDLGNQVRRYGRQSNLKIATTYASLGFEMNFQAIGFGPDDLRLPTLELMAAMTNSGLSTENFTAANVTVYESGFTSPFRVIETAHGRLGVTMVLGDEHLDSIPRGGDVRTMPVDQALTEIAGPLRAERCDHYVLLALTSLERCRQLALDYPWFDIIVSGGVDGEPTREPEIVRSEESSHLTRIIQTGYKGMYVGVIGFFDDPENPVRYQRVPLDARFEDSPEIKTLFLAYQRQMEALGLEGLDVRPVTHPSGRQFVGSEACADCHDAAYEIWQDGSDGQGGPHFRATRDLTDPGERTWVQRHHDPECLSCHVTGWNPQNFYPYQSGYLSLDNRLLYGNGCENCHGPGSHHVEAENGDLDVDETTRRGYAAEMVVTLDDARQRLCFECHDVDNSPDFHEAGAFETYWDQIKHYEE